MDPVFKKLQLKQQDRIWVLHAPEDFGSVLLTLPGHVQVQRHSAPGDQIGFLLAFAENAETLGTIASEVGPALEGDAPCWVAYPKKSSKKYRCDFDRDRGWEVFGPYGLERVSQVAIDEDWSAMRLRKVAYIPKMTRSFPKLTGRVDSSLPGAE
jgi:hypothetical protein